MTQENNSNGFNLPPIPKKNNFYENPFKLPNDDQIFRMREENRRLKEEEKERNKNLHIWEKSKTNVSSSMQRLKDIVGDDRVIKKTFKSSGNLEKSNEKINISRRQEKESTAEFVAKKREMFLVQMSLDTKREEIRKLEEKAQMKEEALQRSEQMLEEDTMRFDAFLKENDKKAHDAIKKAEEETKKKQEKNQEIKRLTQQIQALSSEMSKHREALDDCMRYKSFLDMLTPPEWFEQFYKQREEKIAQIKQENHRKKYQEWEKNKKRLIEAHRKELEARREQKKEKNKRIYSSAARRLHQQHSNDGNIDSEEEDDEQEVKLVIPAPPRLEDEVVELPEEEVPMYFTEPQQLMDIFAALEEQNLFLIQRSQETEYNLEELQHAFNETKLSMDSHTGALQQQIDELQNQIQNEDSRVQSLLNKRTMSASNSASGAAKPGKDKKSNSNKNEKPPKPSDEKNSLASSLEGQSQAEKEKFLGELNNKVRFVYDLCGFDSSSKPSTLFMLSQLESRLEILLKDIERMPPEFVIKAEKEKEKRRRERKREEQQALQIRLQEERNKRAIERSMQAPKKRTGRLVMYRSRPVRTEKRNLGNDDNENDNNDEIKYLS